MGRNESYMLGSSLSMRPSLSGLPKGSMRFRRDSPFHQASGSSGKVRCPKYGAGSHRVLINADLGWIRTRGTLPWATGS
jgi:hypothetical protein